MALEPADLDTIKTLISDSQKAADTSIQARLDNVTKVLSQEIGSTIAELAGSNEPPDTSNTADNPEKPKANEDSTLKARLARMEADLKNEREERARIEAKNALSKELSAYSPMYSGEVQDLLMARFGELKSTDNGFQLSDGRTLNEAVTSFFSSDAGKHFLPATSGGVGTPSNASNSTANPATEDLDAALMKAFG